MTTKTSSAVADQAGTSSISMESEVQSQDQQAHPLVEAGQQAGETVGALAERATDIGFQQVDRAREQAADGLQHVTETIRRVSTNIEEQQPAIANVATTAADQAERFAEYLRTTDARQILSTVEDAARRQPLLFLGGAFALGLAVSRFIKAAGGPSGQAGLGMSGQYGQWKKGSQSGYGDQWTTTPGDFQAKGPGSRGANGMTGDDRTGEGI